MIKFTAVVLFVFIQFHGYGQSDVFKENAIHIGVVTSDVNRSLKFYTEVLGMQKTGGFDLSADFGKRSGLTGGLPVSVTVLKLTDAPSATQWKIMQFPGLKPAKKKVIQDQVGMRYITIMVNSVTPFIERIRANKIPFMGDTPVKLDDGQQFILIQDPDGVFIEIIGPE